MTNNQGLINQMSDNTLTLIAFGIFIFVVFRYLIPEVVKSLKSLKELKNEISMLEDDLENKSDFEHH